MNRNEYLELNVKLLAHLCSIYSELFSASTYVRDKSVDCLSLSSYNLLHDVIVEHLGIFSINRSKKMLYQAKSQNLINCIDQYCTIINNFNI